MWIYCGGEPALAIRWVSSMDEVGWGEWICARCGKPVKVAW